MICPAAGKGLIKNTKYPTSEHFLDYFRQIPFSNRLKVFLFIWNNQAIRKANWLRSWSEQFRHVGYFATA